MDEAKGSIVNTIISLFFGCIAYPFLTVAVILTLGPLVMILLSVHADFLFVQFVKAFAFVNPKLAMETVSLSVDDIMEMFIICSVLLGAISEIVKFFWKTILKKEVNSSFKSRLILSLTPIIVIYALVFLSIPFVQWPQGTTLSAYPIFAIFFAISAASIVIYVILDTFSALDFSLLEILAPFARAKIPPCPPK